MPFIEILGLKPTWTNDLERVGRKVLGSKFKGVFAPNHLPKKRDDQPGDMFLWNTNATTGEHWGATGVLPNGQRLSYDSYGRNTKLVKDRKDMRKSDFYSWTDPDVEQTKSSAICGPLSLAWLTIFKDNPTLAQSA